MTDAARPIRLAALALLLAAPLAAQKQPPACDPDNGGITLPAGFCALVVADNLGPARHLALGPRGDLYVAMRIIREKAPPGGVVALRDEDGDGRFEKQVRFGELTGTGIAWHDGMLYFASDSKVVRYRVAAGALAPEGAPELVVGGLPEQRQHAAKPFAFDDRGALYLHVGVPSNACQTEDRKAGSPGQRPCPLLERHGGVWSFDANRPGQDQVRDGKRLVTGQRHIVGLAWDPASRGLFTVQHGRDQLDSMWPALFTAEQNADLPAEELQRLVAGADFGWPYCYFDPFQDKRVLAPEYGGDGKQTGDCGRYARPLLAFPAHTAPNDMLFYTAAQFPERYRGGMFVAFHGSWNRAPLPQEGYNVAFVPFRDGKPTAKHEVFADGFAGRKPIANPREAAHRPTGLALGADGSLYVSDGAKGRIWRIVYTGSGR